MRVPVYRAHSVAVSAEFERPVSVEAAREVLAKAPGLDLVDEPHSRSYPMPLDVAGKDNCQVGRMRLDCALENGLALWVCGDQLAERRGAERGADRGVTLNVTKAGLAISPESRSICELAISLGSGVVFASTGFPSLFALTASVSAAKFADYR